MKIVFLFLLVLVPATAATAIRNDFTLETADVDGAPLSQKRFYYVFRPDNLPRTAPAPMVLLLAGNPNAGPARFLERKAVDSGFVVVSCEFVGNTLGTVWEAGDPRVNGPEDYDYITAVIKRVTAAENCNDAFVCGLSKGGHMSLAYACVRPESIRAAGSLDEFMGLAFDIPTSPVPIIVFQGTEDTNVPFTMVKDTVDAWRAMDGLLGAPAVTTYEASPRLPGQVTQATWHGGSRGTEVAFVTIIGGTHRYALPNVQTGYDFTDGIWTFFSQFLTSSAQAPRIVSQPVRNIQVAGQPASFWAVATGAMPLRYQWQREGVDLPGMTSNWMTVPAASADGATYRVVVSNAFGTATSAAAALNVVSPPAEPVILAGPAGQSVAAGKPASFTVRAGGQPPITYQWLKGGRIIDGATGASLSIPAALTADAGTPIAVTVTTAAGSVTSTAVTLNVLPAIGAPVIVTSPKRVRIQVNQTATFTIEVRSDTPVSYQWQKGRGPGNMADIPGARSAIYTIPTATLADAGTLIRCVVSNSTGSTTTASEILFVTAP